MRIMHAAFIWRKRNTPVFSIQVLSERGIHDLLSETVKHATYHNSMIGPFVQRISLLMI